MPFKSEDARKAWWKKHYAENRQYYIDNKRAWYKKNRRRAIETEVIRNRTPEYKLRRSTYCRKNRKRLVAISRAWRKHNPDKVRIISRRATNNRRARMIAAEGTFSHESWMRKVGRYKWRCYYCKRKLTKDTLTIDHRIPLSRGGSNWITNVVPACKSCNCSKRDKCSWQPTKQ